MKSNQQTVESLDPLCRGAATQGGGIRLRRLCIDDANQHFLLLHTGQLEALTCPATIMHRCSLSCCRLLPHLR